MIERALSFEGCSGRRAFLAVWALATAVLAASGAGAAVLIRAVDRAGAADGAVLALGLGLIGLVAFGYLRPVLAVSVRRARDLGASPAGLAMVVAVQLMGPSWQAWGEGDGVWMFGLIDAAVFVALAVWPGRGEAAG